MKYFLYYLIAINLITFFAFGIDKRKAEKARGERKNQRFWDLRQSEAPWAHCSE